MLINYLNLIKCVTIILVCYENIEYQIDNDWLEIYDSLRHRKEEINEKIFDINKKRKMINNIKSLEKKINVLKIVTNFNLDSIRIFIDIITTENIPNSKNVDLEEILKIFQFFGVNDKFHVVRFYDKFFNLLLLKNTSINKSSTLKIPVLPPKMIKHILANFVDIIMTCPFYFKPEDNQLINKMKSIEKNDILINILENQTYHKKFTIFLNSEENEYYNDQNLNSIFFQIEKFKTLNIFMCSSSEILLDRLSKIGNLAENIEYLTLELFNSNFSDKELDSISKFKNVRKLEIIYKQKYLSDDLDSKVKVKIPMLSNLVFLKIINFHDKNLDFSNLNGEKLKTLALIDSNYNPFLLFEENCFPNLQNLSITIPSFDHPLIDQICNCVNVLPNIKSIAIFFQEEDLNEDECFEFIKSGIFKTSLVAFIFGNKHSICILENNPDINHSKFYDMIEISDYQYMQFYGVTKFPNIQQHPKFHIFGLQFENLILSDFNFEILNEYSFLDFVTFTKVSVSRKAGDLLQKIKNLVILVFNYVNFEDTNCFREIIAKNKDTIFNICISNTNLSFADILEMSKCQYLKMLVIDQPEFTIQNYDMLFTYDFKNMDEIELINGQNISRNIIVKLLKYKELISLKIYNANEFVKSLLVENAENIEEDGECLTVTLRR
ncbi:hypothetical protein DMUE_3072 [Dictyocoela muelleri]|nr:hypothetical protein DMUE_3072 [Dictyocoela muelleri]